MINTISSIFNTKLKYAILYKQYYFLTQVTSVHKLSVLFVLDIELIRNLASTHTKIIHDHDDQCQVSVATLNELHAPDVP